MSSYFPILIAGDPAAVLPPKPLPADDLQGRLCCCRRSTEELITRRRRGFVLSVMPVLGFGGREEKEEKKRNEGTDEDEEEGESYLSRGVLHPFSPDCLGDLCGPRPVHPETLGCLACLLSHNDIVNGNNTSRLSRGVCRHNG